MGKQSGAEFMSVRGRMGTMAVIAAFWAWSILLSYPLLVLDVDLTQVINEYSTVNTESRAVAISQVAGLALFLITASVAHQFRVVEALDRLSPAAITMLAIFLLSFALQLHDDELPTMLGILYTSLLLATALLLSTVWTMAPDRLAMCLTGASVIYCSFGVSAIAILGWPDGRSIGDIHPNGFAVPLLAAFVLSQFRAGWIGITVRILCFSMVALVSSRFALIGCVVALVLHQLTFDPLNRWRILAAAVVLVVAIAYWSEISTILALDDASRNLSSGLSGRDIYWQRAFAAISQHPFGIGFKRALIYQSGHNGYLKTLLEFGIIGGGLVILCIACNIVIAGVDAVRSSAGTSQQHRFACARFAGLVSLSFGAFFQPQLFSLGDAFAVSLLFLLFKPRMSPTFEGVGTRMTSQPMQLV
jgi:O-antigen ligase